MSIFLVAGLYLVVINTIYSLVEVFEHVPPPQNRERVKVKFDNDEIKVSSDRLKLFKEKGCKCVACGIDGSYFQKDYGGNPVPHFNLYAINKNGKPVLMTKDHIIPKSKGGKNYLGNYQTMCEPCNIKKGNDY